MTEYVTDLVELMERLEAEAESMLRSGRLFGYARDVARVVAWLRTQPRGRVILLAALGAGLAAGVVVLLSTMNRPVEATSTLGEPTSKNAGLTLTQTGADSA